MLSTVGSYQSDSAGDWQAGNTAGAMSPETDVSSSVPDRLNKLLIISLSLELLCRTSKKKCQASFLLPLCRCTSLRSSAVEAWKLSELQFHCSYSANTGTGTCEDNSQNRIQLLLILCQIFRALTSWESKLWKGILLPFWDAIIWKYKHIHGPYVFLYKEIWL